MIKNSQIQEIIDYIELHADAVGEMVDTQFEKTKGIVRDQLKRKIQSYFDPLPVHFEWEPDDCPYDHSGRLVPKGAIDLNQTVASFLDHEYTGKWTPTYESGYGKQYDTYGDSLSYEIISIAGTIMNNTIRSHIDETFVSYSISDDEWQDILDAAWDRVYDECIASELFWYSYAIEYYGLEKMKLIDLVKNKPPMF